MYNTTIGRPVEILLVEDNMADARLAMEAFKEGKIDNNMHWTKDGIEALQFLRREGMYEDAPIPDLILLDLNLPKKNGKEVLDEIKSDDLLKSIPVIILTTSRESQDIQKCYKSHANCYINKPVDLEDFFSAVNSLDAFWLSIVTLPTIAGEQPNTRA